MTSKHQNRKTLSETQISLLIEQYRLLAEDIRQIESTNEKVFGLGVTIISGSILYALKERIEEVFFLAPVALLGIFLFVSHQYHHLFWRGGHKSAIEEVLANSGFGNLLVWERLVHTKRKRLNFSNAMFGTFIFLIVIAVAGFCIYRLTLTYGPNVLQTYGLIIALLFVALVLSIADARRSFESSKSSSLEFWKDWTVESDP